MTDILQVGNWLSARGARLCVSPDGGEFVVTVKALTGSTCVTTRALSLDEAVRWALYEYDTALVRQREDERRRK